MQNCNGPLSSLRHATTMLTSTMLTSRPTYDKRPSNIILVVHVVVVIVRHSVRRQLLLFYYQLFVVLMFLVPFTMAEMVFTKQCFPRSVLNPNYYHFTVQLHVLTIGCHINSEMRDVFLSPHKSVPLTISLILEKNDWKILISRGSPNFITLLTYLSSVIFKMIYKINVLWRKVSAILFAVCYKL